MSEEVKPDPVKETATPAVTEEPEPTVAPPDWFLPEKYKTIDDQAKGVHDAVQKMKETEAELKLVRDEKEALLAERESKETARDSLESPSDELVTKLETKFGKPFEQIKAEYDMQSLIIDNKLKPMRDAILGQQYESALSRMEQKSELFKKFRPQVEAKLAGKPVEERASSKVINNAWNSVIAENIEDIRSGAIEEGKKMATAKPADAPDVPPTGKDVPLPKEKISLTEEEKTAIKEKGGNPEEVEKFYNEGVSDQKKKSTGWNKMFE